MPTTIIAIAPAFLYSAGLMDKNVQIAIFVGSALAACDMPPAETLDTPRILALKTEPAAFEPGAEHTLTALTFDVPGGLAWSFCAEAWEAGASGEPLSCASGAVELGVGDTLTVVLPDRDGWLQARPVDATSAALPAVRLLEADSGAVNPEVAAITRDGAAVGPLAAGAEVALGLDFAAETDRERAAELVVSWYVTRGTLEPRRTLASETATLATPSEAGPLRVIAVVREKAGGVGWSDTTVEVAP